MASTACEHHLLLNYTLLVMVLKKVINRATENIANHAYQQAPLNSANLTNTLEINSKAAEITSSCFFSLLTAFYLKIPGTVRLFPIISITIAPSGSRLLTLRRGTLTKTQIANQTYMKLIYQLYFRKPSAFNNSSPPVSLCICCLLSFTGHGNAIQECKAVPCRQGLGCKPRGLHSLPLPLASGCLWQVALLLPCLPAEYQTPL